MASDWMLPLLSLLRQAGCSPAANFAGDVKVGHSDRSCQPWLLACLVAEDGATSSDQAVAALRSWQTGPAVFSWGWPRTGGELVTRWLGQRLIWWPDGIPDRRFVGLVSSRLGRALDRQPHWFAALRQAAQQLDVQRDLLLQVPTTTTGRFMDPLSGLAHLPVLCVQLADPSQTVGEWLAQLRIRTASGESRPRWTAWFSPPLPCSSADVKLAHLPEPDRVLVSCSEQLFLLRMRRHGVVEQLVTACLATRKPTRTIQVAIGDQLIPEKTAKQLSAAGAQRWHVSSEKPVLADAPAAALYRPCDRIVSQGAGGDVVAVGQTAASAACDLLVSEQWSCLTHWTRRQNGPWPDETEQAYLEQLIRGAAGDRSAWGSLCRIVHRRRLYATRRLNRAGAAVISFTAVPLRELPQRRRFRAHLNRWDFEPYGLCIRRRWLAERGAQPVIYGDESLWRTLGKDRRPFFQPQITSTARRRRSGPIDWSVEQEWRYLGDLDLDALPAQDAVLFVPTQDEAVRLARISRWPVTWLESIAGPPAWEPPSD